MLTCPVRTCTKGLMRDARRYYCEAGHSFDISRSGYVNLLQPQDRRAAQPGDTVEAVRARRRLHDAGHSAPLLHAILETLNLNDRDILIDAGCGEGFYPGGLQRASGCTAIGIDISTPAIDLAARRYPECTWIVANADRRLPILDQCASWVISITARRTPEEFARVLQPKGSVLLALPGAEDLKELRGPSESRVDEALAPFREGFEEVRRATVTHSAHLSAGEVEDLRHAIYRPLQREAARETDITFSLDLITLRKR
jgi:23S rRNA (guanine745-N1)-methyltransferase